MKKITTTLSKLASRIGSLEKSTAFTLIILFGFIYSLTAPQLKFTQEVENRTWDQRVQLSVRPGAASDQIRIIDISQASLDLRERDGISWPWPRAMYAAVVKFLQHAGAKAVAFDMIFSEPSNYLPEDDREFQQALHGKLPVVSAVVLREQKEIFELDDNETAELHQFFQRQRAAAKKSGFDKLFLQHQAAPQYQSVTLPIPELLEASHAFGNVTGIQDSDKIFRHYYPGGFIEGVPVLSLPFALYDLTKGITHGDEEIVKFMDDEGRLTVNFRAPAGAYNPVDIHEVIDSYFQIQNGEKPNLDPVGFKDKWVFVGPSAAGLHDLRPTPLDQKYKGVELNATALDNLINRNFIHKISLPVNVLYSLAILCMVVAVILFVPTLAFQIGLLAVVFVGQILTAYFLAINGYWIMVAMPLSCSIICLLLALGFQYQHEGRQHRFIKDAFKYYVSPAVIDQIVTNPEMLSLGGEKRELSLFFSDIAGFTSISERIEASKLVQLLNIFLTEMTGVILRDQGTVDKYVGDAIVAFWNAPLIVPDHAHRAVRAALRCQERIIELQPQFEKEFGCSIKMRIGINTGVVNVGNFGSKERFNYTVVGDAANLASRLEGANKFFGTLTLISGSTHKALNGQIFSRKVADIKVVGKSEVISIYEPLPENGSVNMEIMRIFSDGMALYEKGELTEALECFRSIPKDPVARVYCTRLERDVAKAVKGEWSSVWNLSEK